MQLRGLVKVFTFLLIFLSLYQLSITMMVRNAEQKMMKNADKQASVLLPGVTGDAHNRAADSLFRGPITDSMQGEVIWDIVVKKYTYQSAKGEELALGLDLQGGMNVTLEVSLDDLVRSMSNNPRDPALNRAIADADKARANSEANFITLFRETFEKENPGVAMASLFTKPSDKDITLQSSNDQVIAKLNKEGNEAVTRTYNVLKTRIDQFGVVNPNVNLDDKKGIITVELAGVHNPERVRTYLQATAKLQFFETYNNQEIGPMMNAANDALAAYLSGSSLDSAVGKKDSTTAKGGMDTSKTAASDTGNLNTFMSKSKTPGGGAKESKAAEDTTNSAEKEAMRKAPLYMVIQPDVDQNRSFVSSPVVGLVQKKDTAKANRILAMDVVKNKFPANTHFVYGSEDAKKMKDPNFRLSLYAVKMPPGGVAKLEGDHVTSAYADVNQLSGKPAVYMDMDLTGAHIWKEMTGKNIGNFVAVVLDDKVYSCPRVESEISGGRTEISGNFSNEEAKDLSNILKSGKLPAPAHIVQEQVVGPTLGAESIKAGFLAIALSFVAIFILMVVYYAKSGWVACISLTLNLLFTVGILSAMHATLTLPGIAGLVLGIGMAVDAHVLIFERIKEELADGKTHLQAIIDGYKRSNAPVLDGHIAQLITASILFYFGLGPVLGFATTQWISISISLFCGILVSRLIKDIWTGWGHEFTYFTPISKAVFRKAHFDFIGKRKMAYIVSAIVLLGGIASLFNGFDYGVEFAGGRSYTIKFDKQYKVLDIRDKMHTYFNEYPIVKTIGTNNMVNITTSYLITKPGQVEQEVITKLYEGLTKEGFIDKAVSYQDFQSKYIQSSQTVLPTISDDLIRGAMWATFWSLISISIYILVRFRKWQYSLGTFMSLLFNVCATLAIFSFLRRVVPFALEINQHFIAAILTVIGFCMNDTIIVFDRIREYFRKSPDEDKTTVVNRAINDTLPRTVMTSLTVFIVVLILFIFGGEVTRGFAFAMLVGVATGTFSSIFVASPVLVDVDKKGSLKIEVDRAAKIEELKKQA